MTASDSRIHDTDKEIINFTKLNILFQDGTAVITQANQPAPPSGAVALDVMHN